MSIDADLRTAAGDDLNGRARRRPWPRKNTPDQIQARQDILRAQPTWDVANDFVFDWPEPANPTALGGVVEALTAHVTLPVSVVGPLRLRLGTYHLDDHGKLVEDERHIEE